VDAVAATLHDVVGRGAGGGAGAMVCTATVDTGAGAVVRVGAAGWAVSCDTVTIAATRTARISRPRAPKNVETQRRPGLGRTSSSSAPRCSGLVTAVSTGESGRVLAFIDWLDLLIFRLGG